MSADDKHDREIKAGKGWRETGVQGRCYFSKVVREDLTEKMIFEITKEIKE